MEETISGGRREKNARPSINSYMYGNAMGIAQMAKIIGYQDLARKYEAKADTLKHLVETQLWDADQQFFEVYKPNAGEAKEVAKKRSYQPSGDAADRQRFVRQSVSCLGISIFLPMKLSLLRHGSRLPTARAFLLLTDRPPQSAAILSSALIA